MGFLINTDIHPFILEQPELLRCQVKIRASDYRFLDHDSYISCIDLFPFGDNELLNWRSHINIMTKAEIKKAVKSSKAVEVRYQKLILSNS